MRFGKKSLIILAAAAAAIIIGILLLTKAQPDRTEAVKQRIFSEDDLDIRAITVKNGYGNYQALRETDGKLEIQGLEDANISEGEVSKLHQTFAALTSIGISREKDVQRTNEAASAEIETMDGRRFTLYVGAKCVSLDGYYAWSDNSDTLYVVNNYIFEMLGRGLSSYIDLQLLDFSTDEDYNALKEISFQGKDVLEMSFANGKDGFEITEPIRHTCFQRELKLNLLFRVLHMTAASYVGNMTTDEMGLDDPQYIIALDYKGRNIELRFGNREGDLTYVMNTGAGLVYLVSDEEMLFTKIDYRTAVGTYLYQRDIGQIASLTVTKDTYETRCFIRRTGNGAEPYVGVDADGKEILGYHELMPFYNGVQNLTLKDRLTESDEKKEAGEGAICVTLELTDGRTDVITLVPISERAYSYQINNMKAFSTPAADVERFIEAWP